MPIGTKVSNTQIIYLERARSKISASDLADILVRVALDEDITTEREELLPDWISIFEENRSLLDRTLRKSILERVTAFFEKYSKLDKCLTEVDPRSLNLAFLLGAGACKPAPSNIPTVRELLPQLLERARRLDREDVTKLADFCDRRKIDNIEDLLTAAQLSTFCSRNPTVLRLMNYLLYRRDTDESSLDYQRNYLYEMERGELPSLRRAREPIADLSSVAFLQDTLQVLFGLLSSTMLPAKPNPAHDAIATYVRQHPNSSIVTTNYDCCMDLALGEMGRDFLYRIEFSNVIPKQSEDNCTRLIKLHGSLNWYYCETCQEVQMIDIRQAVEYFLKDKSPYPVIGICRDCGGQRRGLLVPPLAMKFDVAPPLTPLLSEARIAFENADAIIVIGFSFADADVYISRMLSKSMQTSTNQRLFIVDPDHRVVDRVRRKFKASIPNFDPMRIIKMSDDCAVILPKFLNGELLMQEISEKQDMKPTAVTTT